MAAMVYDPDEDPDADAEAGVANKLLNSFVRLDPWLERRILRFSNSYE